MNVYKQNNIQKIVIEHSGQTSLILNDMILGYEGTLIVASLIPKFHHNLQHLEIKGNNIDAQAFQHLFMSLLNCPKLETIHAEWNFIGSSSVGLAALTRLANNAHNLQHLDFKNNRISHNLVDFLVQIISYNKTSLRSIDLRWNDLGQLGAQKIISVLKTNSYLQFIGLEDNRISTHSLAQISRLLDKREQLQENNVKNFSYKKEIIIPSEFPISQGNYPSLDLQIKTQQLRAKIDHQQKQNQLYSQKMQSEIQKVLHKIKVKGSSINEVQNRYEALNSENIELMGHLRESQRMLGIDRERCIGIDKGLNTQKSSLRHEKYHMNQQIQMMMQKIAQKQQRQLEDLQGVLSHKKDQIEIILKDRFNIKRNNRQKLAELKQDRQAIWNRVVLTNTGHRSSWQEQKTRLENQIMEQEAMLKIQQKKSKFLNEQLTSIIMKGLRRQQKYEKDIFQIQNKIKSSHNDMTLTNIDLEENKVRDTLSESRIINYECSLVLIRMYLKNVEEQNSINQDLQKYKTEQIVKLEDLSNGLLELRINDLQKVIRTQQSQNKLVLNQYDKLGGLVENASKRSIHNVIFT